MDRTPDALLFDGEALREIAAWAADCAEFALFLFEAEASGDARPREAIAATRAFALGGPRTKLLRGAAWAALAAASQVGAAAAASARAASAAAGSAYRHPIVTRHQSNHILAPAAYAAHARTLGAGGEPAGDDGLGRAIERAPPAVRRVLRQLPAKEPSRGPLGALMFRLDTALRL
jgi:hypothetical protein